MKQMMLEGDTQVQGDLGGILSDFLPFHQGLASS